MMLQTSVIAMHGLIALAESDETLLLQTHATRKTTVPEGDLLKIMNVSNPGEMSLLVANYAATAVKDGVHLDDSTKDALGAMKTSLTDESQKYITDAHEGDQSLLNTQATGLHGCDSTYSSSTAEDVISTTAVTGKGQTHKTCRDDLKVKDTEQTTACQLLTDFIDSVSGCPGVPGRDGMGGFFASVSGIAASKTTWELRETACKDAEDDRVAKDDICDTVQEEYETGFCTLRLQLHETCAAYTTCFTTGIVVFGETVSSVENNEGSRKIEWTAIEKIKCYIDVLMSDDDNDARQTALEACKVLSPDTSHLDIIYPTAPDEKVCDLSAVEDAPCSPEFEEGYAGFIDLRTCVPCAELPPHLTNPGVSGDLKNLALGQPTSMGPGMWSTFESKYCNDGSTRDDTGGLVPCTYDENGETTQGGSCQSVCHTGHGANAWWQVELQQPSLVETVRVINAWTHCCKDRIIPFHMILLDVAGVKVAEKQFTEIQDEFVWEGANAGNVKSVKIRLDGSNYLHMAEVFVMGREGGAVPALPVPVVPAIPTDGTCPPFTNDLIAAADWHFGGTTGHGHDCTAVCAKFGKVCNDKSRDLQTLMCSTEAFTALWQHAHPNAATHPSCNMAESHCRAYAGTPFAQYGQNCYFFCPNSMATGERSTCDGNAYGHHDVLCACQ